MVARQRVVVTGMGAVTPLGIGVKRFWQGLTEGRSGVSRITRFDPHQHRTQIAAQVSDFDPLAFMEKKDVLRTDLFIQYALAATEEAMHDASLVLSGGNADRTGTSIGTAMGGVPKLTEAQSILSQYGASRAVPYMIPAIIPNMAAGWISMRYGAKGPNTSPSTACAAGSHAIGDAFRLIQRGDADIMLAGGSEAIVTPLVLWGFDSMRALSSRNEAPQYASRPFDAQRDGFVLGEGAGVVILEERKHALARGAGVYAELCGYAMTADAYHPTTPAPDADGATRCMAFAVSDAGFHPGDIDYISAHGTSTVFNDARETKAIKQLFGAHISKLAVSSIKSMIGHTLGASGALATIATIMALHNHSLPPTINYEHHDPECDLDYIPNTPRYTDARTALVNAFAFGGTNAVLALRGVSA